MDDKCLTCGQKLKRWETDYCEDCYKKEFVDGEYVDHRHEQELETDDRQFEYDDGHSNIAASGHGSGHPGLSDK